MNSSARSKSNSGSLTLVGGVLSAGLFAVASVVSFVDATTQGYTAEAALWVATEEGPDGMHLPAKPWVELLRADAVIEPAWDHARRLHQADPGHHGDVGTRTDFADRLVIRVRGDNFIHLAYHDRTPDGAEDNLDAIMIEFLSVSTALKRSRMEERLALLDDQLVAVEEDLETAERSLAEHYRAHRSGLGDLVENTVTARRLERELEAAASLYAAVRQERDGARLEVRSSIPDVRVLDRPVLERDGRRRAQVLVRGLVFLLLAGMSVAATMLITGASTALRRVERSKDRATLALDGASIAIVFGAGVLALMLTWLLMVRG
ncbi:MAG: hypothetical protein AAF389_10615 [Gemmatimonadota bacterium]